MATMKQIAANQRNALKSTGPKSKEGKETASKNATTRGILSNKLLPSDEDATLFCDFRERTYSTLQPDGEIENLLADQIVTISWRLRRVIAVEEGLFEEDPFDLLNRNSSSAAFEHRAGAFSILSRYETALERSLYRALHEFQRLQAFRKGMNVTLPIAVDIDSDENRR